MAKSLIVNLLSGKRHFTSVPASGTVAETFASTFMDGEYAVYEAGTVVGTETVAVGSAPQILNVMFKNTTSDEKGYMTVWIPANKSENDLHTALMGLTLNGVLIDYVRTLRHTVAEQF